MSVINFNVYTDKRTQLSSVKGVHLISECAEGYSRKKIKNGETLVSFYGRKTKRIHFDFLPADCKIAIKTPSTTEQEAIRKKGLGWFKSFFWVKLELGSSLEGQSEIVLLNLSSVVKHIDGLTKKMLWNQTKDQNLSEVIKNHVFDSLIQKNEPSRSILLSFMRKSKQFPGLSLQDAEVFLGLHRTVLESKNPNDAVVHEQTIFLFMI